MSREQWGHGYYTGMIAAKKALQKDGPFPMGMLFNVVEGHTVKLSGIIVGKSGDLFLARHFNTFDGALDEDVTPYTNDEMSRDAGWRWYQDVRAMRIARYRIEGWDEGSIRASEFLAEMP